MTIEYDGGNYAGWQCQKNARTIQGEIESALRTMVGRPVRLSASGRTDAGVHALGQVAELPLRYPALPGDPSEGVEQHAGRRHRHPGLPGGRRQLSRPVRCRGQDLPLPHSRTGPCPRPSAGGTSGSSAGPWTFRPCSAPPTCSSENTTSVPSKAREARGRTQSASLPSALFERDGSGDIVFKISANGFLRFMVRNIVGTLVDVGHHKISPSEFKAVLESRDRRRAGPTAPPQGLFLMKVRYPGEEDRT